MEDRFIIQEIQTDAENNVALLPPVVKNTRNEGESEYYIKLGYAAISNVRIHSVIMYNQDGIPILYGGYSHDVAPEPTPEPEEDDEPEA